MTSPAAPLALAMGVFVLFCVLAIGLIPVLEGILRQEVARQLARRVANDNAETVAREPDRKLG